VTNPCKLAGTSHHAKRREEIKKKRLCIESIREIFPVKWKAACTTDPLYFSLAFLPAQPGSIARKTVTLVSTVPCTYSCETHWSIPNNILDRGDLT